MIQLNKINGIEVIAGNSNLIDKPDIPFNEDSIEFLSDLSNHTRKSPNSKIHSDLATFAFWSRKKNILNYMKQYSALQNRIGRGLIFHISPSNVPLNFAYSFIFGLLSGNSNIVRVPSKIFPQLDNLILLINDVLNEKKHKNIFSKTAFIRYAKSSHLTDELSLLCDLRLIWGGDNTINQIRQSQLNPKSFEITFSDRYSFGIINADYFLDQDDASKKRLYENFYNDTFLMDQNACSSPHLVVWTGDKISDAQKVFWEGLDILVKNKEYEIESIMAMEKHLELCRIIMEIEYIF